MQNLDVFGRVRVQCFQQSIVLMDKIFSFVVLHHGEKLWSVYLLCPLSHRRFSVALPILFSFEPLHCYPLFS